MTTRTPWRNYAMSIAIAITFAAMLYSALQADDMPPMPNPLPPAITPTATMMPAPTPDDVQMLLVYWLPLIGGR